MTKAEKKQRLQQLKGMLSAVTALASPTAAPIPAAQVVSSLSPDQMKEIISRAAVAQSPAIVPTAASLTPPAQPVYPTCTPLAPSPPSAVPSYSTAPSPYDYEEPAPAVRTTSRASARSRSRKDSGDEDDDEAYGKPSSKRGKGVSRKRTRELSDEKPDGSTGSSSGRRRARDLSMVPRPLQYCHEVIQKTLKAKKAQAQWFDRPVDVKLSNCPDYYRIVQHPMDLGTIMQKIEAGKYRTVSEFRTDLKLTWDNCFLYNKADSPVAHACIVLQNHIEGLMAKMPMDLIEEDTRTAAALGLPDYRRAAPSPFFPPVAAPPPAIVPPPPPPIVAAAASTAAPPASTPAAPTVGRAAKPKRTAHKTRRGRSSAESPPSPRPSRTAARRAQRVLAGGAAAADDFSEEEEEGSSGGEGGAPPIVTAVPATPPAGTLAAVAPAPVPAADPSVIEAMEKKIRALEGQVQKVTAVAIAPTLPPPEPPKPRRRPEDPHPGDNIPMTFDEKRALSMKINNLPENKLGRIVEILKARMAPSTQVAQDGDDIEVDIDALDAPTLHQISRYVNQCLAKKKKPKRKVLTPQERLAQVELAEAGTQQKIQGILEQLGTPSGQPKHTGPGRPPSNPAAGLTQLPSTLGPGAPPTAAAAVAEESSSESASSDSESSDSADDDTTAKAPTATSLTASAAPPTTAAPLPINPCAPASARPQAMVGALPVASPVAVAGSPFVMMAAPGFPMGAGAAPPAALGARPLAAGPPNWAGVGGEAAPPPPSPPPSSCSASSAPTDSAAPLPLPVPPATLGRPSLRLMLRLPHPPAPEAAAATANAVPHPPLSPPPPPQPPPPLSPLPSADAAARESPVPRSLKSPDDTDSVPIEIEPSPPLPRMQPPAEQEADLPDFDDALHTLAAPPPPPPPRPALPPLPPLPPPSPPSARPPPPTSLLSLLEQSPPPSGVSPPLPSSFPTAPPPPPASGAATAVASVSGPAAPPQQPSPARLPRIRFKVARSGPPPPLPPPPPLGHAAAALPSPAAAATSPATVRRMHTSQHCPNRALDAGTPHTGRRASPSPARLPPPPPPQAPFKMIEVGMPLNKALRITNATAWRRPPPVPPAPCLAPPSTLFPKNDPLWEQCMLRVCRAAKQRARWAKYLRRIAASKNHLTRDKEDAALRATSDQAQLCANEETQNARERQLSTAGAPAGGVGANNGTSEMDGLLEQLNAGAADIREAPGTGASPPQQQGGPVPRPAAFPSPFATRAAATPSGPCDIGEGSAAPSIAAEASTAREASPLRTGPTTASSMTVAAAELGVAVETAEEEQGAPPPAPTSPPAEVDYDESLFEELDNAGAGGPALLAAVSGGTIFGGAPPPHAERECPASFPVPPSSPPPAKPLPSASAAHEHEYPSSPLPVRSRSPTHTQHPIGVAAPDSRNQSRERPATQSGSGPPQHPLSGPSPPPGSGTPVVGFAADESEAEEGELV